MRAFLFGCFLAILLASTTSQDDASKLTIAVSDGVCFLKVDPGPCRGSFRKWYFNAKTQKCEVFIYEGCQGNANRFDTKAECLKRCKPVKNVCALKPDSGPCKALGYRWYFNPADGECQQFRYGGCRGNANNFKTRAECQEACRNDCLHVRCAGDPCEENKCPAFPDAKCVANYCRGCNADFFVNGKLVDCKLRPPNCIPEGERCLKNPGLNEELLVRKKCCPDTSCCNCDQAVVSENYVPIKQGVCKKYCPCD